METPQLAAGQQIIAVPTLVRVLPEPITRIIGDLSDTDRVLVGLQLMPLDADGNCRELGRDSAVRGRAAQPPKGLRPAPVHSRRDPGSAARDLESPTDL